MAAGEVQPSQKRDLQDPVARVALNLVGLDPDAEAGASDNHGPPSGSGGEEGSSTRSEPYGGIEQWIRGGFKTVLPATLAGKRDSDEEPLMPARPEKKKSSEQVEVPVTPPPMPPPPSPPPP